MWYPRKHITFRIPSSQLVARMSRKKETRKRKKEKNKKYNLLTFLFPILVCGGYKKIWPKPNT